MSVQSSLPLATPHYAVKSGLAVDLVTQVVFSELGFTVSQDWLQSVCLSLMCLLSSTVLRSVMLVAEVSSKTLSK